tara:strand:- start:10939 stop:11670 length:732 start_codon:yes stop_codon:yes gene_type:complete
MLREIVIIGFPKCGTSALVKRLEQDPEVQVRRSPEGGMEMPWPLIRDTPPKKKRDPSKIQAHKFTAYSYNAKALSFLVEANPDSILALCVRDPVRALVSWHNMHQTIARKEHNARIAGHFAWKERDFYSKCSISEYYEAFARTRLRYDSTLESVLEIVPAERLVVVSQERIARDIGAVTDYLKALSGDKTAAAPARGEERTDVHLGYADKVKIEIDEQIELELKNVQLHLNQILEAGSMHKCL